MGRPKGSPRPPGSGRQKGVPNSLTTDVRKMILAALDGAGGQAYLEKQAKKNPKAFLALLGKCLPRDLNIKTNPSDTPSVIDSSKLTYEERVQLRVILENAIARQREATLIEHEPQPPSGNDPPV